MMDDMDQVRQRVDDTPPTEGGQNTEPMPASACASMSDVRREIDRLDRLIVALIADRQTYIEAAGRIKSDRTNVHDAVRIEDVIKKVLAEAARQGLDKDIAEPVWRTLIERCIAHEYKIYDDHNDGT